VYKESRYLHNTIIAIGLALTAKFRINTIKMKFSGSVVTSTALLAFLTPFTNAAVNKKCVNYTIPLKPTTTNQQWANPWKNNYDLVDFVSNVSAGIANPWTGKTMQSTESYNIAAEFCGPADTGSYQSKNGIVLMLSAGLNFDRTYVALMMRNFLGRWETNGSQLLESELSTRKVQFCGLLHQLRLFGLPL